MGNCVMGEARGSVIAVINACKLHLEKRKKRDHLGNIAVRGAITLRWILKEQVVRLGTGLVCLFVCSTTGAVLRRSEHGIKLYDSIKGRQFFDQLRN
jgi:hypothetical protein